MSGIAQVEEQVLEGLKELDEDAKRQVLEFIEFLRVREDPAFIQYVNYRTKDAMAARARGERFLSLEDLRKQYA
jgi:hypothetical protein